VNDFCAASSPAQRAALAQHQLEAIAAQEGVIHAFTCMDPAARGEDSGPLAGALIGVKDIITTADFPTHYGSPFRDNEGPRIDAWCVGEAKRLGAVILGKTVSTEIAFALPGPTVNPHDHARTPGGSSSGSAAAVAAGFVSFAIGTQTAGSTIRPASFCGVTGYKPSYGLLHLEGVQAISTTCDHLGFFTQSPRDAWFMTSATLGRAEVLQPRQPKRLLHVRMPGAVPLEDEMRARMDALARALPGVDVETVELPVPLDDFAGLQPALCFWEAARILLAPGRMRLAEGLTNLLQPYLEMDIAPYAEARRKRARYQEQFTALIAGFDAVLLPAALGVAPVGLANTGDALMSRFWTPLHVPAVTVPLWRAGGLPLAPQLLGALGADRELLQVAQWLFETNPSL